MYCAGKVWDLNSNQVQNSLSVHARKCIPPDAVFLEQVIQFAAHSEAIKSVHWVEAHNMAVTASWDKTLKYWPVRQRSSLADDKPTARLFTVPYVLHLNSLPRRKNRSSCKEGRRDRSELISCPAIFFAHKCLRAGATGSVNRWCVGVV